MFALLLAAMAAPAEASAPAVAAPAEETTILETANPWWEKITVTVDDKGEQKNCRYQASYSGKGAEQCDKAMAESLPTSGKSSSGVFSKLTFERRFSPGGTIDGGKLQPGDQLLGRQVIFLTFNAMGAIDSCKVVATAGDNPPTYDCDEVRKEKFSADAGAATGQRQAFMTILAYGHQELVA
jgi:hypothetical protein